MMRFVSQAVLLLALFYGLSLNGVNSKSKRPSQVHIGSIFSFASVVGKVAKIAVEVAVDDVNSDPTVLAGTDLVLQMQDSNYSGFLGIVEGISFLSHKY